MEKLNFVNKNRFKSNLIDVDGIDILVFNFGVFDYMFIEKNEHFLEVENYYEMAIERKMTNLLNNTTHTHNFKYGRDW